MPVIPLSKTQTYTLEELQNKCKSRVVDKSHVTNIEEIQQSHKSEIAELKAQIDRLTEDQTKMLQALNLLESNQKIIAQVLFSDS